MENNLFGVKVNYPFKKKDFESILDSSRSTKDPKFIFTVNPEFIVDATKDSHFKKVLNKGFFNSADGIGVVLALEYLEDLKTSKNKSVSLVRVLLKHLKGKYSSKRLTGVEISEMIFEYADKNYLSIFLLGGDGKKLVSEKLLVDLQKKFPNARFIGANSSFVSRPNDDEVTVSYIKKCMKREDIDRLDFLLVGYGHPYQEKWIERNFEKINVGIFVGVGGTFDFLTGNIKRAPRFLQKLGLEWLFRLFIQPKRIKRIFKAVVHFSYLILTKN